MPQTPKQFFLTTPLYYVNAEPHIGSAYTTIAADCICRFNKLIGKESTLLTGVDEHGGKIENTAKDKGVNPQEHCDLIAEKFKELWKTLDINYQNFSRTSSAKHNKVVEAFYKRVKEKGDIYKADYKGLYCLACEDFKNERELLEGNLCPTHQTKVQTYSEENYFFALSKYSDKIKQFFKDNPNFIQPKFRVNEVEAWINEGLKDFPISRSSVAWGVPIPDDKSQTVYVWFDALLGYISALLTEEEVMSDDFDLTKSLQKLKVWPASVHLIGKDILRFHAVYWVAMLMSAGLPLPEKVFGHGFLTKDGEKMGKTRGNIIVPHELIEQFGVDAVRFYFMFGIPFGQDGDYTEKVFKETVNAYLANRLGNLFSRVIKLLDKHYECKIPASSIKQRDSTNYSSKIKEAALKLPKEVQQSMEKLELHTALESIFNFVDILNLDLTEKKPWNLLKENEDLPENNEKNKQIAELCLYESLEGLRIVTNLLEPFMPKLARQMLNVFDLKNTENWESVCTWGLLKENQLIYKPGTLFARII